MGMCMSKPKKNKENQIEQSQQKLPQKEVKIGNIDISEDQRAPYISRPHPGKLKELRDIAIRDEAQLKLEERRKKLEKEVKRTKITLETKISEIDCGGEKKDTENRNTIVVNSDTPNNFIILKLGFGVIEFVNKKVSKIHKLENSKILKN